MRDGYCFAFSGKVFFSGEGRCANAVVVFGNVAGHGGCGNDGALLWLCARKKMAEQGSDLQCAFLVLARGCAEKMEAALLDGRWCVAVAAMLQVGARGNGSGGW